MADEAAHVMEETVMESKQSQFWNAVSVGVFIVLFGILLGYGVLVLIRGDLHDRPLGPITPSSLIRWFKP